MCRVVVQEFAATHTVYPTGPQVVKTFRKSVETAQRREPIVALVGFREWIFSGKVCHPLAPCHLFIHCYI
jgi:hypothetical protein